MNHFETSDQSKLPSSDDTCIETGEDYQIRNGRISLNLDLPDEIWLEVFSELDITDVDNILLVSSRFRAIADDAAYREIFKREFGQDRFNRTTTSLSWRSELIARTEALRKWRRGGGGSHAKPNISCTPGIREISLVEPGFDTQRSIVFSQNDSVGMVVDHTRGKTAKPRLGTDQSLQPHNGTNCISASRFGMLFGMVTGKVSGLLFSHDMRSRTYVKMDKFHNGAVTDAWINKESAPSNTQISGLTVGSDGIIYSWDLETGIAIERYDMKYPLLKVGVTEGLKKRIITLNVNGEVKSLNPESKLISTLGKLQQFFPEKEVFFQIVGEMAFIAQGQHVSRFDADGSSVKFNLHFTGSSSSVTAMAIDQTIFPSWITSRGAPGDNWPLFAVADDHWNIHIYAGLTRGAGPASERASVVECDPLLIIQHDSPIESMSMNSVVLLVSTKMGATSMIDVLTGRNLGNACGEAHYRPRRGAFVQGESKTFVDPNPLNAQGMTAVGSVLMYFDLGAKLNTSIKKKGVQQDPQRLAQARRRGSSGSHETSGALFKNTIQNELEVMADEDDHNEHLSQFMTNEMSEDEELEYALMLSQGGTDAQDSLATEDDELKRALEASEREFALQSAISTYSEADDEDDYISRAEKLMSEMSVTDASPGESSASNQHQLSSSDFQEESQFESTGDPDLDYVLALSLQDH